MAENDVSREFVVDLTPTGSREKTQWQLFVVLLGLGPRTAVLVNGDVIRISRGLAILMGMESSDLQIAATRQLEMQITLRCDKNVWLQFKSNVEIVNRVASIEVGIGALRRYFGTV